MGYYEKLGFNELTEVQKGLLRADSDKNILIVSSTGSGKTEASHSQIIKWGNKAMFVQPMKTLASSIFERLNNYHKILNLKEWTEQHSSVEDDKFLQNDYCVTTIDQILGGYLGIGRQALIKGKNVLLSNFVFDEIQLLQPDKTLLTTINMLDDINRIGNKFIIMTATMPSYLIEFLSDRYDMEVIISTEEQKDRKVTIGYKANIDYEIINNTNEKQIIICNTQKQQEEVYDNIQDKSRCIILNSKLLAKDRKHIENNVQTYFGKHSKDNDKILISTQVLEAGMDISANILYSVTTSVDSLIQRAGRCTRWGGNGRVVVFEMEDNIYDKEIVDKTRQTVIDMGGEAFTWKIQKQMINKVLNGFYKDVVNEKNIRKNKRSMKNGNRNQLIRDIQNVNVIVSSTHEKQDFNKQSVSVHIDSIKRMSESNDMYILNKKEVHKVDYKNVEIGDLIVIDGNDYIYDKIGFRYNKCGFCEDFMYKNKVNRVNYTDYKIESWINHAISVRIIAQQKLKREKFSDYTVSNSRKISNIIGLHDLGKLDVVWQGKQWANAKDVTLAHFPYKSGNGMIFKDRNHAVISAYILQNHCSNLLFNVVLQHHKRHIDKNGDFLKIHEYQLHNNYKTDLLTYGFDGDITKSGNMIRIKDRDIIKPNNKNWCDFIYLTGVAMESDIEAIQSYH